MTAASESRMICQFVRTNLSFVLRFIRFFGQFSQ